MAHYAKIENNIVTEVITIDNTDILNSNGVEEEALGSQFCTEMLGGTWVQTSYNGSIRKNYASIGSTYDVARDAFIEASPFPSWVIDEDTCTYVSPVADPSKVEGDEGSWSWDEGTLSWILD